MLFDGVFIPESLIEFNGNTSYQYDYFSTYISERILALYKTSQQHKALANDKVADYSKFLTNEHIKDWLELRDSLGIMHNMFLCAVGDVGITTDLRNAMLAQVFEPLYSFLAKRVKKGKLQFKKCGNETSKKTKLPFAYRLAELIDKYGDNIFKHEIDNGKKDSLVIGIKNNRNRMFHVEKDNIGLTAEQCAGYNEKLSLLYRQIILLLLGVNISDEMAVLAKKLEKTYPGCFL
ncbi:hypothetical protein SDC9_162285 [bioreactor metagenome]|uniref:ApeA N-terminal domain-containing protein n=1 Tax=bioreactor metagenome TaxID=1076179 RepID=A0A645FMQ9_9ZZZZ